MKVSSNQREYERERERERENLLFDETKKSITDHFAPW
jgi:hypothetical protein